MAVKEQFTYPIQTIVEKDGIKSIFVLEGDKDKARMGALKTKIEKDLKSYRKWGWPAIILGAVSCITLFLIPLGIIFIPYGIIRLRRGNKGLRNLELAYQEALA